MKSLIMVAAITTASFSVSASVTNKEKNTFVKLSQCQVIAKIQGKPAKSRRYSRKADAVYQSKNPGERRMLDKASNNSLFKFKLPPRKMGDSAAMSALARCDRF